MLPRYDEHIMHAIKKIPLGVQSADEGRASIMYKLFRTIILGTSLLLFAQVVPSAYAGNIVPLLDLIGGGMAVVPLADAVGGWSFHIDHPLTIGAVGLWDEGKLPLSISHCLLYTSPSPRD